MNEELEVVEDNTIDENPSSNVIYFKEIDWVDDRCTVEEIMMEVHPNKRTRESEGEESDEFITVTRKGKRLNRLTSEEAQPREVNKGKDPEPVMVMTHQEMPRQ